MFREPIVDKPSNMFEFKLCDNDNPGYRCCRKSSRWFTACTADAYLDPAELLQGSQRKSKSSPIKWIHITHLIHPERLGSECSAQPPLLLELLCNIQLCGFTWKIPL